LEIGYTLVQTPTAPNLTAGAAQNGNDVYFGFIDTTQQCSLKLLIIEKAPVVALDFVAVTIELGSNSLKFFSSQRVTVQEKSQKFRPASAWPIFNLL
jgi:hypothetical protein